MFPNILSLLRIFLIIPILWLLEQDTLIFSIIALILFVIAALTDFLDGYIARRTNTVSVVGALLDHVADKLLVCLILIYFLTIFNNWVYLFPILIIVSRELAISSIRQYSAITDKTLDTSSSLLGKLKTFFHLVTIGFLIMHVVSMPIYLSISIILLWVSAIISIYTLLDYFVRWSEH